MIQKEFLSCNCIFFDNLLTEIERVVESSNFYQMNISKISKHGFWYTNSISLLASHSY